MDKILSRVKLRDFNSSYALNRGVKKSTEIIWYIIKMIFFLTSFPFPSRLKCVFLRLFGAKIGHGVIIKPRVNIHMPWKLVIGDDVWIGEEVFLLNFELLTIGSNVCISQRAFVCCGNHNYKIPEMPYKNGPIILMDGCWVGASTFISAGVTVGIDTIVTAGSVVTKNLDNNGIYKGNPVKYIKARW